MIYGDGVKASNGVASGSVLPYPYQPSYQPNWHGSGHISTTAYAPQLVEVTAVKTKAGWLGQIVFRYRIVWESDSFDNERDARGAADEHLERALV